MLHLGEYLEPTCCREVRSQDVTCAGIWLNQALYFRVCVGTGYSTALDSELRDARVIARQCEASCAREWENPANRRVFL